MRNLNYHHLWHFYVVAREGGLRAASEALMLSPSTISDQIKTLEQNMNGKLFERVGRRFRLTDLGRHVHHYADSIFKTGNELMDSIQHGEVESQVPLRVGVVNAMPKVVAYHLLAPLLESDHASRLQVSEDILPRLLANMANDEVDVILSDSPIPSHHTIKSFNHFLGESELGIFASKQLKRKIQKKEFPECLNDHPFLMPTAGNTLSREIENWFDSHNVTPKSLSYFENSSLLKLFASHGHGMFAAPEIASTYIEKQYGSVLLGMMDRATERYYAITSDRRIKHPGILLIRETATEFMNSKSA